MAMQPQQNSQQYQPQRQGRYVDSVFRTAEVVVRSPSGRATGTVYAAALQVVGCRPGVITKTVPTRISDPFMALWPP